MGVSLHYDDVVDAIDALADLGLVEEHGTMGTEEWELADAGWERARVFVGDDTVALRLD